MLDNVKKTRSLYKQTKDFTLQDFIRILFARKWLIIACLVISLGIAIYYIKTTVPVYESSALIMRDVTYDELPGNILGMGYYSSRQSANMDIILQSNPSLDTIKKQINEKYQYDIPIEKIARGLRLLEDEDNNIITMTANANVPEQAQIIANVAADVLMKRTFEIRSSEINQGAEFLKEQMDQIEEKMQETEKTLNSFLDKEGLISNSSNENSNGLIGKLGDMQTEVLKTESDIELKKSQLKTLETLIADKKKYVRSSSVETASPQIDKLQERLINLQLDLGAKLETRTEKDSEVIALRKRVESVQNQLKTEFDKLLDDPRATSLNPVSELQNLTQQYITMNVELKGLETMGELTNGRLEKFRAEHPELASKQVELVRLQRQSRIYEQTFSALASKYQDVRLMGQMKGAGLRIIDTASLPTSPISPKKKKIIMMAILSGLGLGLVIAFFLEYIDDSIKTKEDIERFLGLPVLGLISQVGPFNVPVTAIKRSENETSSDIGKNVTSRYGEHNDHNKSDKGIIDMLSHSLIYSPNGSSKTQSVENYWNLAMSIKYVNMDKPSKTILVTSVIPGERKTTTSSNLAIVKARSGMKVLLIDSDLRRPMLHRIFQQNRKPGLADLLTIDDFTSKKISESLNQDYIRPTVVENLYLLPCGLNMPNSDALLSSDRMRELMQDLKEKFDLIIIDSAPLLVVAGVVALCKESDGVLLAMYAGRTKRKLAIHGKEVLDSVNARIIGVALTGVDLVRQYGYHYRHYYNDYYQNKDDND